jgi:hypothetical protein
MSGDWFVNAFVLLIRTSFLGELSVVGLCSIIHGFDDRTLYSIRIATVVSNIGTWMQSVGVAWLNTPCATTDLRYR